MKTLVRNKWLLFLFAGLLLGNIFMLLSFFVFDSGNRDSRGSALEYLNRELNLDEKQQQIFKEMKGQFFTTMKPMWDDIQRSKDSLYRLLGSPDVDSAVITRLTNDIAFKSGKAAQEQFNHFRELRTYCTPEQQKKFDSIIPRMISNMGSRSRSRSTHR